MADHAQGRIIGGYGALVEFLTAECRHHAVAIYLGAAVSAIEATDGGVPGPLRQWQRPHGRCRH
jgi:phytoene dehydrogenase-like protein